MTRAPSFFCLLLLSCGCSSTKLTQTPLPPWTTTPTRTVDAGYIVYVGQGSDSTLERATFKAEAMAIGDLTNECSLAPKGARIEDRYDDVAGAIHHVYAKIGITFEECEAAKKANDSTSLKALANVAMAEQWKKYQDLYYAPDASPAPVATADNTLPSPPPDMAAAPSSPRITTVEFIRIQNASDYYILRQQVAYAKQEAILTSPANIRTENSQLATATVRLQEYEKSNPAVRTSTWSTVQRDTNVSYPPGFARDRNFMRPTNSIFNHSHPSAGQASPNTRPLKRGKRRHTNY